MLGASIAIDDCYELWESGFVSIPYNFELRDLQPQLQKLLQGPTQETKERAVSEGQPALYLEPEAAEPECDSDDLDHSTYCLDDMLSRDDFASVTTAAIVTAEALAGMCTELPYSSSSQSECSQSTHPGNWPLRMAAVMLHGNSSIQHQIQCRPGMVFRNHEPLLGQARRWRGTHRWCQKVACQTHARARLH